MSKRLHEIQQKLKVPKLQRNTFGKYLYRSCEDILESVKPLLKEGETITFQDEMVYIGERYYIKATANLITPDGSFSTTAFAREPEEGKNGMDVMQVTGAASSYARKFALNSLLCIDDTKDADATNTGKQEEVCITKNQFQQIQDILPKAGKDAVWFCSLMKIEGINKLPARKFKTTMNRLQELANGNK